MSQHGRPKGEFPPGGTARSAKGAPISHSLSIVLQPPLDALFAAPPASLQTRAGTLLGVLHELCEGQARASAQLLDGEALSPFVHVFLNGAHVPAAQVVQQPVRDGDELCLLTAIRGG